MVDKINWEKIINKNRTELLAAIKIAYEKAIRMSGTVAGNYYYQVELAHDGMVSTYVSNGGGSDAVRNHDAILVFLAKITELGELNLLPDDLCYSDYIDEDADRAYGEDEIRMIEAKLREEAIKYRCDFFFAEEALEDCIMRLPML